MRISMAGSANLYFYFGKSIGSPPTELKLISSNYDSKPSKKRLLPTVEQGRQGQLAEPGL
jgi:hypothetical protein